MPSSVLTTKKSKIVVPKKTKNGAIYKLPSNGLWNTLTKQRDALYVRFIGKII